MSHNHYLKCADAACGTEYEVDRAVRLRCEGELTGRHGPALLRAAYRETKITRRPALSGIFQYCDWLPNDDHHFTVPQFELGQPFCYRSRGLAEHLGLEKLFVAFSGYWPEKGANLLTCSFKEFETQACLSRYLWAHEAGTPPPLIIASAGNTGNAYSFLSSLLGLRLYLFVPESSLRTLKLPVKTSARIVAVRGNYSDAIELAEQIRPLLGGQSDGGILNVARRAGMGTVYVNAVVHPAQGAHKLFDHYFQSIGSGSGAIATWEAVRNLIQDGRFGERRTEIHVAQNEPYTPVPDAWRRGSSTLLGYSPTEVKIRIASITASVLSNPHPAYSIAGGLYDVLQQSGGVAWKVTNSDAFDAAQIFRTCEGVDIAPAGAVTVAALVQAVHKGRVKRGDQVLLHVTGGGHINASQLKFYDAEPEGVVEPRQVKETLALFERDPEIITSQKVRRANP